MSKSMGRERQPLKRERKGDISINISDIFRNPDIQETVIKNLNNMSSRKK